MVNLQLKHFWIHVLNYENINFQKDKWVTYDFNLLNEQN